MRIVNTPQEKIREIKEAQLRFFASGATLGLDFRRSQLKKLLQAIQQWQRPLCEALWNDLHKSEEEAILTELSIVEGEIKNHIANLSKWTRRKRACTPLKMMPSSSYTISEPLGCALIISPWNYPVQLLLNPLVGAISSGCTAILKASPYVPNVSTVIEKMISSTFDSNYIALVQGNRDTNNALLAMRHDIIFFTGSPSLGKSVMKAAAEHLTPVVLELGGKSPCIVDADANIEIAARRIAWGKTLNAGQTCIAPDYMLIHRSCKGKFIEAFKRELQKLHGNDIKNSRHYARIVNDKAFERLSGYLSGADIITGGDSDATERYIAPTLIDNVSAESPIMQEEIFGPLLPMLTFDKQSEAIDFVRNREKPLALYYFGKNSEGRKVLRLTSSGGACINDTVMHIANENIPFGGVGNSGLGQYHGEDSFKAFSHTRSVVTTPTWLDLPFRYMPYRMFALVKKLL